jgi:predicted amidohydrolase
MKVAACQLQDVRSDVPRALEVIAHHALDAQRRGARLVCFPEAFLQGYSLDPKHVGTVALDLHSSAFRQILDRLRDLEPVLVIGLVERAGRTHYNTAAVVERGKLVGRYRKVNLLRLEKAVFEPGDEYPVFPVDGLTFGVSICYDLCFPESLRSLAKAGAELVVCPCNNMLPPPAADEWRGRHNEIRTRHAEAAGVWLLSSDVTGERDGHVCYGPTALIDPFGAVVQQLPLSTPGMLVADVTLDAW